MLMIIATVDCSPIMFFCCCYFTSINFYFVLLQGPNSHYYTLNTGMRNIPNYFLKF